MEEKNKGGRPRLEDHVRRSKTVSTRLTEYGYERVTALANQSGRSVNDYLREVLRRIVAGEVLIRIDPPEKKS